MAAAIIMSLSLAVVLIGIFSHLLEEYIRRKRYLKVSKAIITEVKISKFDNWMRAIAFSPSLIMIEISFARLDFGYINPILTISYLCIFVIMVLETKANFLVCDNGVYFSHCFIEWKDIIFYKIEDVHNPKYKRFIVTSKRRPPFYILPEYTSMIKIPHQKKEIIDSMIKEKTGLSSNMRIT